MSENIQKTSHLTAWQAICPENKLAGGFVPECAFT
jgi:hypothetical protein